MLKKIEKLLAESKKEQQAHMIAINKVKEQIHIFNKKGEEITATLNNLQGKIEVLEEILEGDT